ncbi:A kinase (PRKA) interacting protein 1 [Mactra antiquata]
MANRQYDGWSYEALQRSTLVGQQTYMRAKRVVDWPSQRQNFKHNQSRPCATLENAFENIKKSMAEVTKQCQGYYDSHPPKKFVEQKHCCRFHTYEKLAKNVFSNKEDFKVSCHPDYCQSVRQ